MSSVKLNARKGRRVARERFMALNILVTTCEISGIGERSNYVIFIWYMIHACT